MAVWLEHNGISAELTSAMIRVTNPSNEEIYARETAFERPGTTRWEASDFELPAGRELGRYLVSFDAVVVVQTESGPVNVRVAGTDAVEFFQRRSPYLRDFQATPQHIPAGEKAVVSGIAVLGSPYSQVPFAGEQVEIWFDPKGTAPRVYRGSATSDARGYFETTLVAPSDGIWRAVVPESDRYKRSSPADTPQETRQIDRTTHSGSASKTAKGYAGGVRIIATDIVVGMEPATVRFDAGIRGLGWARSASNLWFESRRGEGRYPNGIVRTATLEWQHEVGTDYFLQSTHTTARVSPLMPAGVYDVGVDQQYVSICFSPAPESRSSCKANVIVNDRTITTMTVKRASSTSVSASAKTFTGPKTITLSGAVRKVQLVSDTKVANRLSPNTPVKLYFDPAGSRGPVYKKTVKTGSGGTYSTKVGTSISGRWIAEYPGTALQAPSQHAVTITVR
ncbi:hypothetical protein [Promicromonospora sp. MEB111]|uniref:hypothetical protein n=1 Tax=Promicromonospora sp. MEB111 TaxID=3040301 RepID=UPI002550208B|nr:hypothetical protein [Promicromonospora sp. MEB111]